MEQFLGIHMMMGIAQISAYFNYWAADPLDETWGGLSDQEVFRQCINKWSSSERFDYIRQDKQIYFVLMRRAWFNVEELRLE